MGRHNSGDGGFLCSKNLKHFLFAYFHEENEVKTLEKCGSLSFNDLPGEKLARTCTK